MAACGICNTNESKYKCPKCSVGYCLIGCFKSPEHKKLDEANEVSKVDQKTDTITSINDAKDTGNDTEDIFLKILQNDDIQAMLKSKGLQFHLLTLIKMINDTSLTGEIDSNARMELTLRKLAMLRTGGSEENEIVEQFATRVSSLLDEK